MGHHINPGSCSYAEEFVIFSCCGISIHKERGANILHDVFSSGELGEVHYDSPGVRHCMQNKFGAFYTREEGNAGTEPRFSLSCAGAHTELVSGRASLSDSCFSLNPEWLQPRIRLAAYQISLKCVFLLVFSTACTGLFLSLRCSCCVHILSKISVEAICRHGRGTLSMAVYPASCSAQWCFTSPVSVC